MKLKFFILVLVGIFIAHSEITLEQAPDFTVTDTDGKEHHLQSYLDAGKYVIIDFWGIW